MQVTIQINCDNAAFAACPGSELAKYLWFLAQEVQDTDLLSKAEYPVMDVNGTKIGAMVVRGAVNSHEKFKPEGTPQWMLSKLRTGATLVVGQAQIWAEPEEICVRVWKGVNTDKYPLTEAGLLRALKAVGYEG